MLAEREALKVYLRSRQDEYLRLAVEAGKLNPDYDVTVLPVEDLRQTVDGFLGLLFEALDGEDNERTDFYLSVVVPGLVAAGHPIEGQVHGFVTWTMLIMADVAASFPAQDAGAVHLWLASFLGQHCRRMIVAARQHAPAPVAA